MLTQRLAWRTAQRLSARQMTMRQSSTGATTTGEAGFKLQDNAFNRARAAHKSHAAESAETWRKLSLYVACPLLLVAAANAWTLWNEHWEHEAHAPPPSERPQYSYLNLRNKPYPWGDGNKTLFWNDKVNYAKGGD